MIQDLRQIRPLRTRRVLLEAVEARRLLSVSLPDAVADELGGTRLSIGDTVEAGYDVDGAPAQGLVDVDASTFQEPHDEHDHGSIHVLPAPQPSLDAFVMQPQDTFVEPPYDFAETFNLNSLPGADKVIYLDFTGHTTTGTQWNTQGGPSVINTPAWSLDTDFNNFSDTERFRIQEIWGRVAEDFAPFNINVTTVEPSDADLRRTGGSDDKWGVRIAIGADNWFGGAGGVAILNSFRFSSDTPAFVFTNALGNNSKSIAEATSHEAGHTFGLRHDGESGFGGDGEYYNGHDSGFVGWAPIMGIGYNKQLTQWSAGEYANSTVTFQNDISLIGSSTNGAGIKADDHSDVIGSAATVLMQDANGDAEEVVGTITTRFDQDTFAFAHGGGNLTITADVVAVGPNLDTELTLYRDNGDGTFTLVDSDNPEFLLNSVISGDFAPGDYLVQIDGVGRGDPLTNPKTGYTDFGSVGQYYLNVDATAFNNEAPTVVDAWMSGSNWTPLVFSGIGDDRGLQILDSGVATEVVSPLDGVDTISVRFSERVIANGDELIASFNGGQLALNVSAFSYDTSTDIATFGLLSPINLGEADISFLSSITDFSQKPLEDVPAFSVRVLPGDATGDGRVDLADFTALRNSFGRTQVDPGYSVFTDFDQSTFVDLGDFTILRNNFGVSL
jgi:hypothetical protein